MWDGLVQVPKEELMRAAGILEISSLESDTFENKNGPITVQLWEDDPDGKTIWVPRRYAQEFGFYKRSPTNREFSNLESLRVKYKPKHPLWELQKPAVHETVYQLQEQMAGILQAKCGAGKTVMGLNVAARLGLKTLIVVNREFLLHQWVHRIETFLGIPREDIGIIRQAKAEVEKPICVGLMQSLYKKPYSPKVWKGFGLVIVDEVHRIGAPAHNKIMAKIGAPFRLGLSATPTRKDGLNDVIRWHMGDIIAVCRAETAPVGVWTYNSGSSINSDIFMNRAGQHRPELVQRQLSRIEARNARIVDLIDRAHRKGRKTLVLSHFLDHLRTLRAMWGNFQDSGYFCGSSPERPRDVFTVDTDDPDKFIQDFIEANFVPTSVEKRRSKDVWKITALGLTQAPKIPARIREKWGILDARRSFVRIPPEELVETADKPVIFATFSMAKEALDIATLDTEIFATPAGNVEQAVGRIARVHPDKLESVVVDIVDHDQGTCLKVLRAIRNRTYKRLKYNIRQMN